MRLSPYTFPKPGDYEIMVYLEAEVTDTAW